MPHTSAVVLALFLVFQIKHFVCDFLYQPPYMWMNKGNIRHWGGYAHAGLHVVSSFALLLGVWPFLALNAVICIGVLMFEFIAHYLIDWTKMNINSYFGWKCNTHEEFWQLLGFDQFLHQITYILMITVLI